ncbi:MAG: methylated-DNA--[protein]-cysteine S-methyltransferase [Flavobacteriales bacterium]|jgi:O-6-methylguanine DNA methyltransferase
MPEALSPAAYNASLEGPLGRVWVASDGDRITQVSFAPLTARCTTIPGVLTEALRQLEAYMRNGQTRFDLPIRLEGTPFQQEVWGLLNTLPPGRVLSYQQLAGRMGGRTIARTVGNACGANPLPILVPCHRVVGSNGSLTGYVGELWRKQWLLKHEGARTNDLFDGH